MSKEAKIILSVLAWILGSAAANGLLGTFVPRPALDWVIVVFVVGWGIGCIWLFSHL